MKIALISLFPEMFDSLTEYRSQWSSGKKWIAAM